MIGEKQLKVLAFPYSRYDALICDGAIRSGKTSLMMVAFIDWAMREFDHQRFIILGKTVGSATRNIVEPFMQMAYARGRYQMSYRRGDNKLVVRSGARENWFNVFGGKDGSSYQLIQGFTAAGCLVDEVTLCTQSAVNQALARCSVDGSRYFFSCNPASPRHWFYTDWIQSAAEHNALHLHFTLRDNPGLSEHVIERYERQYTGVFRKRYIEGEWVLAEGLVYDFPEEDYTGEPPVGDDGETVPGAWYISIDYGITNPFAALLWLVTTERAYIVDEYVHDSRKAGRRLTDGAHYAGVEALAGSRPVQAVVIDPSATSFKEELVAHDRFDYLNASNDVVPGIAVTANMLKRGRIKISSRCKATLAEMGLYRWDDSKSRDAVVKENDHCMDAMRYFANSVLKYELGE